MSRLALILFLLLPAMASAPPPVKDFLSFWREFRAAVLAPDTTKIDTLTRFPFRTRGPLDSDPVQSHTREQFRPLWPKLLASDPGLKPQPETMRQLIQRTERPGAQDWKPGAPKARIGNFVFEQANGKWLFTFAYTE
jgi:hypothetical protein